MDVGLAIRSGRGLDGEPDVGSGIQLPDNIEARGLDDVLERAAGLDGIAHRASTDGQARHAVWSVSRQAQRGGTSYGERLGISSNSGVTSCAQSWSPTASRSQAPGTMPPHCSQRSRARSS
jgi:hypothetical protein